VTMIAAGIAAKAMVFFCSFILFLFGDWGS
jgi:hypothetical protein